MPKILLAVVERWTTNVGVSRRPVDHSCLDLAEHARRTGGEHGEEHGVARQLTPLRVVLAPEGLRDAERDPAGERSPQRTEATDDHRLERVDQTARAR